MSENEIPSVQSYVYVARLHLGYYESESVSLTKYPI